MVEKKVTSPPMTEEAKKSLAPRLLIIGHGRHGKDTLAEQLQARLGWSFTSSSMLACNLFMFPDLALKYGYATPEECFEDRHNHRAEWFQAICEYNRDDRTRLAKAVWAKNDVYVGMRSKEELDACLEACVVDIIVWVDASDRFPPESSASCTVTIHDAHFVIHNNHTLEQFVNQTIPRFIEAIGPFLA
jgi:hypothetical protein